MATAAEITAEIAEITTAISHILKGGQSYTITSGGSGTSRTVTMADYEKLTKHRNELRQQLAEVNGTRSFRLTPGW